MKVLLVNPRADHEMKGPHPLKSDDMGVFPHLGLMYLAATLNQAKEYEVKLFDMVLEGAGLEELRCEIEAFAPELVGFTTYTDCLYDLKLSLDVVKVAAPKAFICAGGPHVEIYPTETLSTFPLDCLIRGDGEYAFQELCRCLNAGEEWRNIKGVGWLGEAGTVMNEVWQVESLDDLSFPDRTLSSMERVRSAVSGGMAITSICSSRGCPLPCTFCNSPYKKYRLRSAVNVINEMRQCHDTYGITEFFFFDDLFNISRSRVHEICEEIEKLPFKVAWSFRGRINNLDEETIQRCKSAGCNRMHFGIEAGTERILNLYKKGLKKENVVKAFAACRRAGVETVANFMIGAPTETREEIKETIKFAGEIDPDYVEYHVLIPYPYTAIYRQMLKSGQLKKDVWTEHALDPKPNFIPPLANDLIPTDELFEMLNAAYRRFYFRPSYIWRQLHKVEGMTDMYYKARSAFRLMSVTK